MEGIFRKAGSNVRKRQLQNALFESNFTELFEEWKKYTYHDMASALKSVLMHLSTPLLTKRLMPLFLQVSGKFFFKFPNIDLHIDLHKYNLLMMIYYFILRSTKVFGYL